ncbi:DUF5658 family protein [Haloarcula onubensis]|uniref:DUF5658 family protein n=1 Tax=Haloarcula onubensis TaxID=2950539 RepID=A0ABU2FLW3_9EURY|nr:DUF5658 family protein [Halomicroarcula sp. S3CR25-11]MDS0281763.1 DUF5658 family protein [Halomicroarcula sp. S3CR25-11]
MQQTLSKDAVYVADSRLRCDHLLWGLVLVGAAGDVLLTLTGLSLCFTEANPVAQAFLDVAGGAGLVTLKLAALLVLFAVYRIVRPLYRRAALVAFFAPQLVAVSHNGLLIARYAGSCV